MECRGGDVAKISILKSSLAQSRRESARMGLAVAHGSFPREAQLGSKGSEGCIVAIGAEVCENPNERGAKGLDHVVEGDLGDRIDDCIVLDAVAADLESEEDRAVHHEATMGQIVSRQ